MNPSRILVVDDEPDIRNLLHEILEDEGYQVTAAENAAEARQLRRERQPDLILLDIWMPDCDGITLLQEWATEGANGCPVVMMSGHGTVETAVEATRLGAYDFIEKPLSLAKLLLTVEHALSAQAPAGAGGHPAPADPIEPVGRSPAMRELRAQAKRLAGHDSRVLISGELGSGKHCLARYLHAHSSRRHGPFLRHGCAAVSTAQAAAAIFGSEDGQRIEPGCLEAADSGSVLLTDLCELEPRLQAQLGSALQAGHYYRVGGNRPVALNTRLIAAVRRDPELELRAGRLREDLYYLLNMVPLRVPPLHAHCEDVPELLAFWVDRLVEQERLPYRRFSFAAQNRLRNYRWPGNVRELKNLVQRLLIMGQGQEIGLDEVEAALAGADGEALTLPLDLPLRDAREQFERLYVQQQLKRAKGSVGQLAKLTGMERTHLYRKLKALGIDPKEIP